MVLSANSPAKNIYRRLRGFMFDASSSHSFGEMKVMLKKVSAISCLCASAALLFCPQPVLAINIISVNGFSYEIQVQEMAFEALIPPATHMPWWGNQALANDFATALGSQSPFLLDPNLGPLFAWETREGLVGLDVFCIDAPCFELEGVANAATSFPIGNGLFSPNERNSYPWATATLVPSTSNVPGPLPLFGAAAAFGFSRKLRVRIKASKTPGSTPPSI